MWLDIILISNCTTAKSYKMSRAKRKCIFGLAISFNIIFKILMHIQCEVEILCIDMPEIVTTFVCNYCITPGEHTQFAMYLAPIITLRMAFFRLTFVIFLSAPLMRFWRVSKTFALRKNILYYIFLLSFLTASVSQI